MSRFGFFPFPGPGHLDPVVALGRCLVGRGHEVTVFHITVTAAVVERCGLRFSAIDGEGTGPRPARRRPRRLRYLDTIDALGIHAERVLREGPAAVQRAGIDGLIVDQLDLAGGTIAERLQIPYLTLCCAPQMWLDPAVPSPFFRWQPRTGVVGAIRNRVGNAIVRRGAAPALARVNRRRREWRLGSTRT